MSEVIITNGTHDRGTVFKPWRLYVDGANLKIQQYVDREWKTKDTITGE